MPSLRNWATDHPEWWPLAISAAAWIVLLWHAPAAGAPPLCLSPAADAGGDFIGRLRGTGAWSGPLLMWATMTFAMMPPLAIPLIRHVAVRSFAARRRRAVAEFLAGALGAWLLVGAAGLPILVGAPMLSGDPLVAACGFAFAALWQLTPMKRTALLRCHRTFPLAPVGWQADRDCAGYGFAHGRDCVASCWALMLAAVLASHGPVAILCVQFIALSERRARRPRLRLSALVLVICAALFLIRIPF